MLQFAAPFGLLALGALLAPILIHLVRRPRRVVKVGSLRPLEDARRQTRSWHWQELLLLAVRCTVLAALALSLAGLRWQPRTPARANWLLLAPGAMLDAAAQAEWDQWRKDGLEPRVLTDGFPRVTTPEAWPSNPSDAWSLLRELDLRLPAGSRAVIFGPTESTRFRGERPTLSNVEIRWRVTPANPAPRASTTPIPVGIAAASNRDEDARYVRAALTAIGASIVTDGAPEWIFQLGNVDLPSAWRERIKLGARLVTDAPDAARPNNVARWFEANTERVRITRRVTLDPGVPVWRDSAGEPLVIEEKLGVGAHWRFAIRFHPDWSDWPLESSFPAWWREQLHPAATPPFSLAPEQATPRFAPVTSSTRPPFDGLDRVDLRGWCWMVAVALFITERALSWKVRRRRMPA